MGTPESEVQGADMGPIWGRQDPGGLHFDPMNLAIWARLLTYFGWGQDMDMKQDISFNVGYDNISMLSFQRLFS